MERIDSRGRDTLEDRRLEFPLPVLPGTRREAGKTVTGNADVLVGIFQ